MNIFKTFPYIKFSIVSILKTEYPIFYGQDCVPQNSYVEAPTPSISGYNSTGR